MRLILLRNIATLASKAGTPIVVTTAVTMSPSAWAHHRPQRVQHDAAHRGVEVHADMRTGRRIAQFMATETARDPEAIDKQSAWPVAESDSAPIVAQSSEPIDPSAGQTTRPPTALEQVQNEALSRRRHPLADPVSSEQIIPAAA